jgi:hypothetical protein
VGAAGPPRPTILNLHQPRFAILRLRGSKNLNIKEFEQNCRRLVGGLDRSYSRRARRARGRGAASSQKHAKQTKDIPTSPFQFFRDRSKGKSKVPARSPFVSFISFCSKIFLFNRTMKANGKRFGTSHWLIHGRADVGVSAPGILPCSAA